MTHWIPSCITLDDSRTYVILPIDDAVIGTTASGSVAKCSVNQLQNPSPAGLLNTLTTIIVSLSFVGVTTDVSVQRYLQFVNAPTDVTIVNDLHANCLYR